MKSRAGALERRKDSTARLGVSCSSEERFDRERDRVTTRQRRAGGCDGQSGSGSENCTSDAREKRNEFFGSDGGEGAELYEHRWVAEERRMTLPAARAVTGHCINATGSAKPPSRSLYESTERTPYAYAAVTSTVLTPVPRNRGWARERGKTAHQQSLGSAHAQVNHLYLRFYFSLSPWRRSAIQKVMRRRLLRARNTAHRVEEEKAMANDETPGEGGDENEDGHEAVGEPDDIPPPPPHLSGAADAHLSM